MILNVRVIPKASPVRNFMVIHRGISNGASKTIVKKENERLKVYLTKPAQGGLANAQLITVLSEYLKVRKYQIKIIKGQTSRNKLIEINA